MMKTKKILGYMIAICLVVPALIFAQQVDELIAQNPDTTDSLSMLKEQSPDLDDNDMKMFIDKIEVIGQLERPQAMFILPGSTPDIDDIQIEHSFFKEIFRPVEKRGRIQTKNTTEPSKDRKDYIPW